MEQVRLRARGTVQYTTSASNFFKKPHRELNGADDIFSMLLDSTLYEVDSVIGSPQAGSALSATKLPGVAAARNGRKRAGKTVFDAQVFLESAGAAGRIVEVPRKSIIFTQGVPAKTVMYIQQGGVKLSVVNEAGKEAVVAMLGPGDFFGEGCLAGQPIRMRMASAITPATVLVIEKDEMIRLLHSEREFSDRFISYLLARNIRIEADLVDQLFNSTEKRLARALLLLARCQNEDLTQKVLPKVSQETLAETIGTTRSRVNLFMNKFEKMGFIKYNGGLQINSSLLSAVLHE